MKDLDDSIDRRAAESSSMTIAQMGNMGDGQMSEMFRYMAKVVAADMAKFKKKANHIAVKQGQERVRALLSGELVVGVCYEDPDITPIAPEQESLESHVLCLEWGVGLDYMPNEPIFKHLSVWLKDIFNGNYKRFLKHIERLSADEVQRKLEMRESLMKRSAIFHVVLGAQNLGSNHVGLSTGHIRILSKLLDLGARLDVHDVSGNSPLHYTTHQSNGEPNKTQLTMARMLLEKGANVNIQNRLGEVALLNCVSYNFENPAKLLLEFGADPTIESVCGMSPLVLISKHPEMEAIFNATYRKSVKGERKVAKKVDDYKKCEGCKCPAGKRCSGCYLAWYCSGECQKGDWSNHKGSCKARRNEYVEVEDTFNSWGEIETSSYQVVKIKMALNDRCLFINNKEKSISGTTDFHKGPAGPILIDTIKSKGFKGTQGYFSSFLKKGVLYVHPSILPPETW